MGYDYEGTEACDTKQRQVLLQVSLNTSNLLVPQYLLPELVQILNRVQGIEGYSTTAKATPLTFSMNVAESFVTKPMSEREKKLQEELDQRNRYWLDERDASQKLRTELQQTKNRLAAHEASADAQKVSGEQAHDPQF